MTINTIGTRNSKKSVNNIIKAMKQNFMSNQYTDDATERILAICKCLQSIMNVNNIGTEK